MIIVEIIFFSIYLTTGNLFIIDYTLLHYLCLIPPLQINFINISVRKYSHKGKKFLRSVRAKPPFMIFMHKNSGKAKFYTQQKTPNFLSLHRINYNNTRLNFY